jgi:hypothetical protein
MNAITDSWLCMVAHKKLERDNEKRVDVVVGRMLLPGATYVNVLNSDTFFPRVGAASKRLQGIVCLDTKNAENLSEIWNCVG